jgi:hypothetical protein
MADYAAFLRPSRRHAFIIFCRDAAAAILIISRPHGCRHAAMLITPLFAVGA